MTATMAVDDDGIIVGDRRASTSTTPAPTRCGGGSAGPLVGMLFTGPYRIPHLGWDEHRDLDQHLRLGGVPRPVDDGDHRARARAPSCQ